MLEIKLSVWRGETEDGAGERGEERGGEGRKRNLPAALQISPKDNGKKNLHVFVGRELLMKTRKSTMISKL